MSFPNIDQFAFSCGIFFVGLGPLLIGGFIWFKVIQAKRKGGKSILNSRAAAVALIFTVIGCGWTVGLVGAVSQWVRFRISPDEIQAIRIVRLSKAGQPQVSQSIEINDREKICHGFKHLSEAKAWSANHESLLDGYRIQIRMEDESFWPERYLSIYRHSTRNKNIFVVIPHMGPGHWGAVDKAGDYSCPEFWEWVEEVIAPLFEKPPEE